jgi:hypothetical protein
MRAVSEEFFLAQRINVPDLIRINPYVFSCRWKDAKIL